MNYSTVMSLTRFHMRCMSVLLAFLILSTWGKAEEAPKLDAKGRSIYEALLDSPFLTEFQDHAKGLDFVLLRVSGHPRYAKRPNNNSAAEVIYDFKAPLNGTENRIDFLIYADNETAAKDVNGTTAWNKMFFLDPPQGSFGQNYLPANSTFENQQLGKFGVDEQNNLWVRSATQIGRVVVVGRTDTNALRDTINVNTELGKLIAEEGDPTAMRSYYLLGIGKMTLDQPQLKALLQ